MRQTIPDKYRQPSWGPLDGLFKRCLTGSTILGVLVLAVVFLAPHPPEAEKTVEEIPERFAKLIVQKPKPPQAKLAEKIAVEDPVAQVTPDPEPAPPPKPKPKPKPRREQVRPKPKAPDAGKAGRERAKKEVTEKLAQTTKKVETALQDLSASLTTSTDQAASKPKPKRRRGRVRSARSSGDVRTVEVGTAESGASADLASSHVEGDLIAIEALTSVESDLGATGGDGTSAGGTGAGPGVFRSNASLLAVVRKYAPGIQFCYENELKRDSSLEGKLVVTLTVNPDGSVGDASIAEDTVGSERLLDCALAQIRDWKFPPIDEGFTTFRTPFVFTPPKQQGVASRD